MVVNTHRKVCFITDTKLGGTTFITSYKKSIVIFMGLLSSADFDQVRAPILGGVHSEDYNHKEIGKWQKYWAKKKEFNTHDPTG